MRRSSWGVWFVLAIVASGCGKDPFGPPSRIKPVEVDATPEPQSTIFMIVPGVPTGELEVWGLIGQREANLRRVMFRIMGPGPDESADKQPEMVRRALNDGAAALIVVPGGSPELPKALAEAEAKKVPVVVLGQELIAPEGSPPFTVVMLEPFEVSAGKIVAAIVEDAGKAGRPTDGTTLLVADENPSRYSEARISALKSEAEKAGLKNFATVPFDGTDGEAAKKAVMEAIKAHPDTTIVLAEDVGAIMGASQARLQLGGKAVFFVGGYVGFRAAANVGILGAESCVIDGKIEDLAKLAVVTAIARIGGQAGGERVIQVPKYFRGTGEVATEEVGRKGRGLRPAPGGAPAAPPAPGNMPAKP